MVEHKSLYSGRCKICGRRWRAGKLIYIADGAARQWCCSEECCSRAALQNREGARRAAEWQADFAAQQAAAEARRPAHSWPAVVLRTVPAEYRPKVYRALARVLHPDTGGDTALAAALNDARDRLDAK